MSRLATVGRGASHHREGALEGQVLIEERSTRLLEQLERRGAALLGVLRESRVQQDALHSRLTELERRRVELEANNAKLAAEVREEHAGREALAQRCSELETRLAELEATRLELTEENRELDEQNRELEAHNRRLLEPEPPEAGAPLFHRQTRRAQGLSALMGRRHRLPDDNDVAGVAPPPRETSAPPAPEPAPGAESGTPSEALPADAPSPQALLDQWYRRYPSAFFKGHTRPLQVGIHETLTAREPWPEKLVRRALACYVNLPRYLKSLREGAERLDLAGEPAGQVDAAAAEHARKKLERLQADRRLKGRPARQRGSKADAVKGGKPGGADPQGGSARRGAVKAAAPTSRRQSAAPGSAGEDASRGREPATLEEKLTALLAKHNSS